MCPHCYINREWLISAAARRVYLVTTIFNISLLLLVFTTPVTTPHFLAPYLKLLLLVCSFGAATTLVAMLYFLLNFDESSVPKQAFWALVLMAFPLGPPLYFFFVYSRSAHFGPSTTQLAPVVPQ